MMELATKKKEKKKDESQEISHHFSDQLSFRKQNDPGQHQLVGNI